MGLGVGALIYEGLYLASHAHAGPGGAAAARDGAVLGLGVALMVVGSWGRPNE